MTLDFASSSRAFRHPAAVAERRALLKEPHIAPLADYVDRLRLKYPDWEFQDFDPMDGGVSAEMLFLLEKPGPKTSPKGKRLGSGFISRDNDDPTAEAIFNFMEQANIDRKRVAQWNVIPWWDGEIKIKPGERYAGAGELSELLKLLPRLKAVVLVGRQAAKSAKFIDAPGVQIFVSAHPSPKVRNMNREKWDLIPGQWAEAAAHCK
jgi:hypothetical protein